MAISSQNKLLNAKEIDKTCKQITYYGSGVMQNRMVTSFPVSDPLVAETTAVQILEITKTFEFSETGGDKQEKYKTKSNVIRSAHRMVIILPLRGAI
jgi:hypothetical protein